MGTESDCRLGILSTERDCQSLGYYGFRDRRDSRLFFLNSFFYLLYTIHCCKIKLGLYNTNLQFTP